MQQQLCRQWRQRLPLPPPAACDLRVMQEKYSFNPHAYLCKIGVQAGVAAEGACEALDGQTKSSHEFDQTRTGGVRMSRMHCSQEHQRQPSTAGHIMDAAVSEMPHSLALFAPVACMTRGQGRSTHSRLVNGVQQRPDARAYRDHLHMRVMY